MIYMKEKSWKRQGGWRWSKRLPLWLLLYPRKEEVREASGIREASTYRQAHRATLYLVVLKEEQRMETFQKDGEKDLVKKITPKTKASSKRRVRGRLSKEEERERWRGNAPMCLTG
jgi:hypothetical protein